MDSSDSSLRLRVCEVSQVPVRTFDTRPPALPRPLHTSYVVRRRTILASSNRRDWPADRNLHEALTHGSLALELMSSSDKTPARQSPSARIIFLLTFRHLYEISSFQLTSSAKLVLAYTNLGLFNRIVDTIPSFCAELALEHFLVMGVLGVNNLL